MLSLAQVRDICFVSGSPTQTCKYLQFDWMNGSLCTKLNAGAYAALEKKRKGLVVSYLPTGDNCKGYLYLKHKEQGYDK